MWCPYCEPVIVTQAVLQAVIAERSPHGLPNMLALNANIHALWCAPSTLSWLRPAVSVSLDGLLRRGV